MLAATVTQSVVDRPVRQAPDICATTHARGPATATARTIQ